MATGTVKWFNDAKGFGFIAPDNGEGDIFAHFSAVQMDGFRTLKQGSKVSYELVAGPKGMLAQNIQLLQTHGHGDAQDSDVMPLQPPHEVDTASSSSLTH